MAKLKSISGSQRFRLACSSFGVFLLAAQFLRSGSLAWGAVFALYASFLYFRQTANMLSALPLFTGAVLAPFFVPHGLGTAFTTLFSAVVAGLICIALGTKNLVLIHRAALLEAGAYALSYVAFLLFFMRAASPLFLPVWLFTVFVLWLSFYLLVRDYRVALVFATVMGGLAWTASWLPIGFVNAASLCFAFTLFAGDAAREKRVSGKNTAVLVALVTLIFVTSHWRI